MSQGTRYDTRKSIEKGKRGVHRQTENGEQTSTEFQIEDIDYILHLNFQIIKREELNEK